MPLRAAMPALALCALAMPAAALLEEPRASVCFGYFDQPPCWPAGLVGGLAEPAQQVELGRATPGIALGPTTLVYALSSAEGSAVALYRRDCTDLVWHLVASGPAQPLDHVPLGFVPLPCPGAFQERLDLLAGPAPVAYVGVTH